MVFNIFKTVKPFIQMKSQGEPLYTEEFEADSLDKAGCEIRVSPLKHPLELGLHST